MPNRILDITGVRFGSLVAIERSGSDKGGRSIWLCLCDCGNKKRVASRHLVDGGTRSCGCKSHPPTRLDISGMKFGRLTVVGFVGISGHEALWDCMCDCGKSRTVVTSRLTGGKVSSCKCEFEETRRLSKVKSSLRAKMRRCWVGMHSRCENVRNVAYQNYGGRGITVCQRWSGAEGFDNFCFDMGPMPAVGRHTVDRKDNNEGYSPSNCRWATFREQSHNRTDNHLITYNGETLPMSVWAERLGVKSATILARLRRGWSEEDAIRIPVKRQ